MLIICFFIFLFSMENRAQIFYHQYMQITSTISHTNTYTYTRTTFRSIRQSVHVYAMHAQYRIHTHQHRQHSHAQKYEAHKCISRPMCARDKYRYTSAVTRALSVKDTRVSVGRLCRPFCPVWGNWPGSVGKCLAVRMNCAVQRIME